MSKTDRKVIDVDGVVSELVPHLLDTIDSVSKPEDFHGWDILQDLPESERRTALATMAKSSFWANLPVKEGAQRAIADLRAMGHEIVWATSPWSSCKDWEAIRYQWLAKHFDVDLEDVIVGKDKHDIPGRDFIDDKSENVEAWQKSNPNGRAWLYDTPHNQDFNWPRRFTWEKDLEKIL